MKRIQFARSAISDLDEIWDYVAERSGLDQAQEVIGAITGRIAFLSQHPGAGLARPELGPGVHSFVIYPYLIYYRPTKMALRVLRIRHGARKPL